MDVRTVYSSTSMLQSSNLFLNMTTEEDSTTYSGSLFHTLIILWVKKHFFICNLHLLTFNFQLWPPRTCPPPSSNSSNQILQIQLYRSFSLFWKFLKLYCRSRSVLFCIVSFRELGLPYCSLKRLLKPSTDWFADIFADQCASISAWRPCLGE